MTPAELEYKYRNRMSLPPEERAAVEKQYEELLRRGSSEWSGASPTDLDPVDASAFDIKADPSLLEPVAAPVAATEEATAAAPVDDGSGRDAWVTGRTEELMRRGRPLVYEGAATSPEMARVRAEAEYYHPADPNSPDAMSPQVRAAIAQQSEIEGQQRQAALQASLRGEPSFNARDFARQREEAALAQEADAQRKWQEWTTGGSLERMARYAPDEYARRQEAAAAERRAENERMRTDPEYRAQQIRKEEAYMDATLPQANRALQRQMRTMGINTDALGDPRSPGWERGQAISMLEKAKDAEKASARAEVQKRAMLRQNPMAYMGRDDVDAEQRAMLSALMLGRGATPNDIKAVQAKMFLEGLQEGQKLARQNININPEVQEAQAAMAMEQIAGQREARRRPDEDVLGEKYAPTGYFGYDEFTVEEQHSMYDDLVAQGYTPADAQRAVDRQATKRRATKRASWRDAGGK